MIDFEKGELNFKTTYIKNLLNCLRRYPYNILDNITGKELIDSYGFKNNAFWKNYIIDLDVEKSLNSFSYKNILYLYTAKIFKINGEYYREKLRSRICSNESMDMYIKKAQKELLNRKIEVNCYTDNVFVIEESNRIKVKFKVFKYIG